MKQTSAKVIVSDGNATIESRILVSLETIQKIESHPDLVKNFLKDKNVSHTILEDGKEIRTSVMGRKIEHEAGVDELVEVRAIHEFFIDWISDMPDDEDGTSDNKDKKILDEEEPEPEMAMIAIPVFLVRM